MMSLGIFFLLTLKSIRNQIMNKIEIAQLLEEQEILEKNQAKRIVDLFFNSIAQALIRGERIEIRGFCSFEIKEYPSYTGRNPKTGESVTVEKKCLPVFRPGRELRSRVNDS